MALVECPECSKEISDKALECPSCGFPIEKNKNHHSSDHPKLIPTKNRSLAILLALFFGGAGIHKFYLNRPRQGIMFVLFSWTFIPLIISLFDVYQYVSVDDNTFHKRFVLMEENSDRFVLMGKKSDNPQKIKICQSCGASNRFFDDTCLKCRKQI